METLRCYNRSTLRLKIPFQQNTRIYNLSSSLHITYFLTVVMKRKTFQKIFVLIQTNTPCRQQMTTKLATSPAAQPELFGGRGGFFISEHFDTRFMYLMYKFWCFPPKILLKLHFKWDLIHRCFQTGHFFQNQDIFFCKIKAFFFLLFSKKGRGDLPTPLVAHVHKCFSTKHLCISTPLLLINKSGIT